METESTGGIDASTASTDSPRVRGLKFPKKKRRRKPGRRWQGTKSKRVEREWKTPREAALTPDCEKCGEPFPKHEEKILGRTVDHIVPRRMVTKYTKKNPHQRINLMCLCNGDHGIKTSADRLFCRGDRLGYLEILRQHSWPMERVEAALAFYGF